MTINFLTLADEDKRALAAFLRITDRLRSSDLFKDGQYELNYHLHVDNLNHTQDVRLTRPPEKDVRDALYDIRKFVAESEDTSFFTICSRLYQLLENSPAVEDLKTIRELYKKSLMKFANVAIGFKSEDGETPKLLKPHEILDLWFNAEYFHADMDKAAQLRHIRKNIGPMAEFVFLNVIADVSQCSFFLAHFIRREFDLPQELKG